MTTEITVPMLPESVVDATVSVWHKKVGDAVAPNEHIVDLETDKVMLEVTAQVSGVITSILKNTGSVVKANEVLALITPGELSAAVTTTVAQPESNQNLVQDIASSPAGRRIAAEHNIDLAAITGTGKGGRVTKENVIAAVSSNNADQPAGVAPNEPLALDIAAVTGNEQRVPMSRLRLRIAERLLDVTQNTAMLTTFNEVNLQQVIAIRQRYRDTFEKEYQVKLGFMSFFVRAVVAALKKLPVVNATIDGNDIVYRNYYDIGVAVSTERGLVVPVLRGAADLNMAAIERQIGDYAAKARAGKLALAEMQGGTFTITNGGVFGSLLSTPIINAPQSAILGMHKIQERPVVEEGAIVIRPMMYLALSYDHRLIDGRESVTFLLTIKELLEDPARLLLEV
jgi:2-oxoglutarate dehydrogenase E2 component (dihydrolipoamide succinyltransferase)